MKHYRYLLTATAALLAMTGCTPQTNTAAEITTEPAQEATQTQEPQEVTLPAPELTDEEASANANTQPEDTQSPEQTENAPETAATPQVPENTEPYAEVIPEFAPLTKDKWDIKLPKVELTPGKASEEHSAEVEKQLNTLIAQIESGTNLNSLFRDESHHDYDDSYIFSGGGGNKGLGGGAKKSASKAKPSRGAASPRIAAPAAPVAMESAVMAVPAAKNGGGGTANMGGIRFVDSPNLNMNTEEYSQFDPNRFMSTATNPLSTFGADVDTAAYTVFRSAVSHGRVPKNMNLRTEEMINYFKYDYPNPKPGEPFSVTTEISKCPWNDATKLMLIGTQTRELKPEERPASNIVFLLDISGSMRSEDRLDLIKASIVTMLPNLTSQDKISIVTYSGRERFIIDGVPGDHHKTILKALNYFEASGVTNGEAGIQMAYAVAQKNYIKGGNNRIIMGTDGDLNVGITSTNELKALIEKKRASGIFLSVLGVGTGNYKDSKLETLADYGNGSYHYLDSIREGKRVLSDEFMSTVFVVAKDVKFQVDFNPSKIKGYRQLGYETRKLNAEDFADDTKDGGEIGAGHQVTILYEIVEEGSSVDIPQPASKYQKVETVKSDEYATVKLRYKHPNGSVSSELSWPVTSAAVKKEMSANMNMASAIAATAMILNDSPFKGTATYNNIINQLKSIPNIEKEEYRSEFVDLVSRLSKL
ncbi:MAG: von Willebrand factor type A domain-containing protein [Proteobacteria bacterium]|nr:von Willebrand factor type A domain-containing protein [Pseudomonadota bacterium]